MVEQPYGRYVDEEQCLGECCSQLNGRRNEGSVELRGGKGFSIWG